MERVKADRRRRGAINDLTEAILESYETALVKSNLLVMLIQMNFNSLCIKERKEKNKGQGKKKKKGTDKQAKM